MWLYIYNVYIVLYAWQHYSHLSWIFWPNAHLLLVAATAATGNSNSGTGEYSDLSPHIYFIIFIFLFFWYYIATMVLSTLLLIFFIFASFFPLIRSILNWTILFHYMHELFNVRKRSLILYQFLFFFGFLLILFLYRNKNLLYGFISKSIYTRTIQNKKR